MPALSYMVQISHPHALTGLHAMAIIQLLSMQKRESTTERGLRHWLRECTRSEQETLARLWEVPFPDGADSDTATALADMFLTPEAVNRVLATLTPEEQAALNYVLAEGGSIAAPILARKFGAVRPHSGYSNPRAYLLALQPPPSATERLFILGLIQRKQKGQRTMFSVPVDLRPLLPGVPAHDHMLHFTATAEPPIIVEADIWALEWNVLTILALAQAGELVMASGRGINKASLVRLARRWGMRKDDLRGLTYEQHWHYVHFLRQVLQSAGLLRVTADQELRPTAAAIEWLQSPRLERLRRLLDGWVTSEWDELKQFLGITIKGYAFDRDLAATHRAILEILAQAPAGTWITWETLLDEVLRVNPDFARPEGNYDTWRLVDYRGQQLDGFEHWREVEGELLKATIGGSLRWLGLTDYGGLRDDQDQGTPIAFRLNSTGAALLNNAPAPVAPEAEPLVVQGTFEIIVPPHATPFARFHVGRVAARVSGNTHAEAEVYKLTKASVQTAAAQGMSADDIAQFLEQASGTPLPPNVAYSLREWSGQYGQLTMQPAVVLKTDDPLLFERLRRDRRLRLPPVEALDAQTWLLDEGDAAALATALRKAGYGLSGDIEPAGPALKERDLAVMAAALKFYAYACAELRIESDVSTAMSQRVARLLNGRQRDTADRIAYAALAALRSALSQS